jgi:uncharacterized integral membrane protein
MQRVSLTMWGVNSRMSIEKKGASMTSLKTISISIVTLTALAAVFIYQNTAVMQLTFLFWSVSMSTSLIILAAFFAGCIAGLCLLFLRTRTKGAQAKADNRG